MPMPYLYENSVENNIKYPQQQNSAQKEWENLKYIVDRYVIINFATIGFTLYSFTKVKYGNFEKNSVILYPLLFIHTHGGICVFLQQSVGQYLKFYRVEQ